MIFKIIREKKEGFKMGTPIEKFSPQGGLPPASLKP